MKLMDARKVADDYPVLVSWSSKADVFAVAYDNGHICLYRMNWQKVFDCGLKEGIPDHITWHPEGTYVCFTIRKIVYILEVDRGRLISKFNVPEEVSWLKWRPTTYEVVNTDKKTEADIKPNKATNQQIIEKTLSSLIFGCRNGHIYVYAGGSALLYHIKPPSLFPRPKILAADLSDDLQSLEFIGQRVNKSGPSEGTEFFYKHCRNFVTPPVTDTITNLIFLYSSLRTTWKQAVGQLNTLSDSWSKIYDVYNFYISHTPDQPLEEAIAQYYELALNRVDSVEISVFLSAGGRDKEMKRKLPVITTSAKSMVDLVPLIKVNLTRCTHDVQAICRFMRDHSPASEDKVKLRLLRKAELAFQELMTFIHHFHCLSQIFADDLIQFLLLITYTIHSFHSNDYITEMYDIRRVLRLLDSKVSRNMFEYYLLNHTFETQQTPLDEKIRNPTVYKTQMQNMLSSLSGEKLVKLDSEESIALEESLSISEYEEEEPITPPATPSPKKRRSPRISSGSDLSTSDDDSLSPSPRKVDSPGTIDLSKPDCDFLKNVFRSMGGQLSPSTVSVEKLLDDVFKIPLVDPDPSCVYAPYVLFDKEGMGMTVVASDLWTDSEKMKTHIFIQMDSRKMYLFEVDSSQSAVTMKSGCLTFSRDITTTVFYTNEHLTTVSYDPHDKEERHEFGRSIVCQLSIADALAKCRKEELGPFVIEDEDQFAATPTAKCVEVHVPVEVEKPGPSLSPILSHVLPLGNLCPYQIAVSGVRKVGVLVNDDRNRILILDLDLETAYDEEDSEIFY